MRWSFWASGAALAVACSSAVDAGRGAAKSTSPDAGGGQSAATGGAVSMSTGGTIVDSDARARSTGGSTSVITDGAAPSRAETGRTPPIDAAGEPPAYCIPPCIWRALAACGMPSPAACIEEKTYPLGPGASYIVQTTTCIPGTGWSSVQAPTMPRTSRYTVSKDGVQCFGMDLSANPPEQYLTFYDAAGHAIAEQFGNAAICAEGANLIMLTENCTATHPCNMSDPDASIFVGLPPGATGYILRPDAPECAAWKPPYAALPCSSTVTGSCGDAGAP
jgi:hypothetical protein